MKIKGVRVKPKLKSFNCNNCGSPVEVSILGQSLNVVCPHCKSIIDANDPNFKILQEYTEKKTYKPYIPIGAKGKLKGKTWACTGFMVKSDSGYFWREYLLFNPYHGYRWLIEVDGHWGLYKKVHRASSHTDSSRATYKGKTYKIYANGIAVVEYVEGEFYWRVMRGDSASVHDYICPPSALSVEISPHEENWTLGHHIEAKTIQKAFSISSGVPLPYQVGVGQLQPSLIKEKLQKSGKTLLYALVALFLIHLLRVSTASKKVIFNKQISIHEALAVDNSKFYTTPPFEIEGGSSNLELSVWADINNSWVFADILLVDTDTQKGIPMPIEVSFYHGYGWKEGSITNTRLISNIPAGEYYLSIRTKTQQRDVHKRMQVKLTRDVPISSNFFIMLVLVILGPLFNLLQNYGFEKKRWANSDYSPYHQE